MGLSGFVLLRTTAFTKLAALTTLASLGLIGLTWAIHEGRFGWWFYVLWIVWAAVAVEWIGRRLVGGRVGLMRWVPIVDRTAAVDDRRIGTVRD